MVLSPVTTLCRGAESATYRVRIFIPKEESPTPGASLKFFEAISGANAASAAAVEPNAAKPATAAALSLGTRFTTFSKRARACGRSD